MYNQERRVERLTVIIKGWLEDGCPLDAAGEDSARHLAEEIVARANAWV